jgi:multicomponent Na+:H+ antiporter subunit E
MNQRFNKHFIYKALALFVIWLLLTESYSLIHISLGLAAALGVALLNTDPARYSGVTIRWTRMLTFLPWLFGRILVSGLHMSYLILHPKLPIAPMLIRQPTTLGHEPGIVLLGNAVTLTPGTVTAEANGVELVVHAMDDYSLQDLKSGSLEREVAKVFHVRQSPV